jgi:hypothetical protein
MNKEEIESPLTVEEIDAVLNENSKYEFIINEIDGEEYISEFTEDVCEKIKYWVPFYLSANMEQLMNFINKVNASFKGNVESNCDFQNEDHLELIEEAYSESGLEKQTIDMNCHIANHIDYEFQFSTQCSSFIVSDGDRKKVADDIKEFLAVKKRIEECFDSLAELKLKKWKENKVGLEKQMMTKVKRLFNTDP